MGEFYELKDRLDRLKADNRLHFEWAKLHVGSLVLKSPKEDVDEIKRLLGQDLGKDEILNKVSYDRLNPLKETKFIIIHKEDIKQTQDYLNFNQNSTNPKVSFLH